MLETIKNNEYTYAVYRFIYSFHMPTFIFVSGYFSKYNPRKALRKTLLPYIIFQILYLIVDHWLFNPQEEFSLQFTTPYFLMWYLLVLFFYNMLLPIFQINHKRYAPIVLLFCLAISLFAGYDGTIAYYLSLSRALFFLPFFVAGYYTSFLSQNYSNSQFKKPILACAGAFIIILEYLFYHFNFSMNEFYGFVGYEALNSYSFVRLIIFVCAFLWIALLLNIVPDRRIPLVTDIGRKTLPVFLLHGFCQRLIIKTGIMQGTVLTNTLIAGMISVAFVLILSCNPLYRVFKKLFS